MPELPDLEVFSKNINKRLAGKQVTEVTIHRSQQLNVTPETLTEALNNTSLSEVKRAGKTIHFLFSNQQILEVHLMLKGEFDIVPDDALVKPKILSLRFDDDDYLVISDKQNLAKLRLNPKLSSVPDALDLSLDYLTKQLKKRAKRKIKAFLIDQEIVRGIGNAYCDEILWESRIAPESLCGKIPEEVVTALFNAIGAVLTAGIEQLQQQKPDLLKGEYREFLKIHNPNNAHSPTGQPIHSKKIASKKTYYSDEQVCYS
jgi:formamidopyrimidine-DNA glycosylase